MQRYLDGMEAQQSGVLSEYVMIADYLGKLRKDASIKAADQLFFENPLLQGRIAEIDGYKLVELPNRFSGSNVRYYENAEDGQFDLYEPCWPEMSVCRISVIQTPSGGRLALHLNHAVADGRAGSALLNEFWSNYRNALAGKVVHSEPRHTVPPYVLLKRRGILEFPEPPRDIDISKVREAPREIRKRIRLSSEETKALRAYARSSNVTIHALICSAILISQCAERSPSAGSTAMTCWSPVDLRNRCRPKIPATQTTNFTAMHQSTVEIQSTTTVQDLAYRLKQRLAEDMENGLLSLIHPLEPPLHGNRPTDWRNTNAFVSNLGQLEAPPDIEDVVVFDVRLSVFVTPIMPVYPTSTFNDRLSVECIYPKTTYSAQATSKIVDEIAYILHSYSQQNSGLRRPTK